MISLGLVWCCRKHQSCFITPKVSCISVCVQMTFHLVWACHVPETNVQSPPENSQHICSKIPDFQNLTLQPASPIPHCSFGGFFFSPTNDACFGEIDRSFRSPRLPRSKALNIEAEPNGFFLLHHINPQSTSSNIRLGQPYSPISTAHLFVHFVHVGILPRILHIVSQSPTPGLPSILPIKSKSSGQSP
jgi:hypothetical protein